MQFRQRTHKAPHHVIKHTGHVNSERVSIFAFPLLVMKLFTFALGLLGALGAVRASEEEVQQPVEIPTQEKQLSKFNLEYVIEEFPELAPSDMGQMTVGLTIKLFYTFTNEEDIELSVVGLGGAFRDPITGDYLVNLTSTSLGPLVVEPGQTINFRQSITLDMQAGNYFLMPQVYVAFEDSLKVIQARGQLTNVDEVPISFFNPQLLLLELIFVGLIGGVGYFFFYNQFQTYFNRTSPAKKVTAAKSSGFDPLWVPEYHQATQRKSKTRKAY